MRILGSCLLFFSLFFAAPVSAEPPPAFLVLTNVNIVDVRAGNVLYNMTMVARDQRISSIAKVGLIGRGRNIRVVNGNGAYLIPGLWDMHVHSAGGPAAAWDEQIIDPLYVANGVLGVRDMGGDAALLQDRKKRIARGERVGPTLIFGGPFLVNGPSDAQMINVTNAAQARQAVDTLKQRGVDFIKILNVQREAYFAVAEECKKQKIPFAGHVPESVSASEASAAGQKSIEHLSGISLACSLREADLRRERLEAMAKPDGKAFQAAGLQALDSYDREKARLLFVQFVNNMTWQVPTLVWTETASRLDDRELANDPRLKYVPAWARAQWEPEKLGKENPPEAVAIMKKTFTRDLELVRVMRQGGVLFLAGTDGPDPYVFPGFSLHQELELMVRAGATPLQALQAATYHPAMFFAKLEEFGVVEKGRVADLVLLEGNPLEDIRNTRRIAAVVLHGRYFSREDLDQMLAQVEARAKQ